MKKYFFRNLTLIAVTLLLSNFINAQVRQQVSTNYDRNSMSVLMLDAGDPYSVQLNNLMDSLRIPEKYFDNSLNLSSVPIRVDRVKIAEADNYRKIVPQEQVLEALKQSKVANLAIAKWFDRADDGSFGVKTLAERGVYNATDNAMLVASASKRGSAGLMDMGMGLVDKSYFIVLDFAEILSMNEIYERDSIPVDQRTMNGFQGKVNSYVYKLDFSEPIATRFFQDLWISGDSENKEAKKAQFDQTDFPLIYVNTFSEMVSSTQLNPGQKGAPAVQRSPDEMLESLMGMAYENSLLKLENTNDAFRVKGMVYEVNPIAVKIGRKEGLKFDQRYFVYENRQDRKGNVYSKRKGVIRSMSVADNRKLADGDSDPSLFYQVAGGRIDNLGMFVEQKNASGINLFAGYTEGGLSGGGIRLEILLSPLLYEGFAKSGPAKGMTGWKIYLEGAYGNQEFMYEEPAKFGFYRGSIGLSKEIYLTRNVFLDPFAGYGLEGGSPPEDTGESYDSQFVEIGSRLGINITHNVQLMPAVNLYAIVKSEYLETKDSEPEKFSYSEKFEGRGGAGISLGLRFMF